MTALPPGAIAAIYHNPDLLADALPEMVKREEVLALVRNIIDGVKSRPLMTSLLVRTKPGPL